MSLNHHLDYVLGPPMLALVFLLLGWPYARMVGAGRPLNPVQQKMLFYGFFFVLGMGYSMALGASFGWKGKWALVLTVTWGAFLAFLACWRHRKRPEEGAGGLPK